MKVLTVKFKQKPVAKDQRLRCFVDLPTACFTNQENLKASLLMNSNIQCRFQMEKNSKNTYTTFRRKTKTQCYFGIMITRFDMFQLKYVFVYPSYMNGIKFTLCSLLTVNRFAINIRLCAIFLIFSHRASVSVDITAKIYNYISAYRCFQLLLPSALISFRLFFVRFQFT